MKVESLGTRLIHNVAQSYNLVPVKSLRMRLQASAIIIANCGKPGNEGIMNYTYLHGMHGQLLHHAFIYRASDSLKAPTTHNYPYEDCINGA